MKENTFKIELIFLWCDTQYTFNKLYFFSA